MRIYEVGTGYTSIPANKGAATEIVVENLSHALIGLGHDVTVVDIEDPARLPTDLPLIEVPMPKGFSGTDEALGIKHKLKRVVYSIALAKVLKRVLEREEERAVVHFHNQYNAYFFQRLTSAHVRARALVAYTNHSGVWNHDWEQIEAKIKKRYFQEISAQKNADLVFTLNRKTTENLIKHVGVNKDAVVPIVNGVDVMTYRPLSPEAAKRASERLFGEGTRYVFQCGSVNPNKGQLRSIKATEPLLKADPSLRFGYAGGIADQAYANEIVEYCCAAGIDEQVSYLGERAPGTDLAGLYAAADAFVFPSEYEGFSLSLLESLSCGVPVIRNELSRVESILAPEEGFIGYQTEIEFTDHLGRILSLGADDRAALSLTSRNAVVEKYSWDKVAEDYAAAFSAFMTRSD